MEESIAEIVKNAGVVGAGGAGFPTYVKLEAKADTYIVNGAECEPLLRVDQQLILEYPERVIKGLLISMKATGAKKGIIALKRKYKKAVNVIKKNIETEEKVDLFLLDDFYPAGDEHVLIYEILNKKVPEGGIPIQIGVVVNNVGTMINVANAFDGKNVISRTVTVTGLVKKPQTIKVPIGTTIQNLIDLAGGVKEEPFKVIAGGPMMGRVVHDLHEPITKTSSGIIVLPEDHYLVNMKTQRISTKVIITKAACIRCQICTDVCPRYLLGHNLFPDKVMRAVAYGNKESHAHLTSAFLCVNCGVCTYYGCPMGLDPDKMNREVRAQLITEGMKNPHKRSSFDIHSDRKYRKIPVKRLIARLNLDQYNHRALITKDVPKITKVRIPLKQHIGVPSLPVVSEGDIVKEGDLIAKIPEGSLGSNIHASISGKIVEITNNIVIEKNK